MKKNLFIVGILSLTLASSPAFAQYNGETIGEKIRKHLTEENIGKAVGAAAGALLGSQFGDGRGTLAAVAIGTLAGYWIGGEVGRRLSHGDREGIARTTQSALETSSTQTWRNPDTGVFTRVSVRDAGRDSYEGAHLKAKLAEVPPLELINEYYVADVNINVRGGPGTDYVILHRLGRGERVPVIGKVVGTDWYMISEDGMASGFVYAALVSRSSYQPHSHNAIREAMLKGERPQTYLVEDEQCRIITQEVILPDETKRAHHFKACRQADGNWMEV